MGRLQRAPAACNYPGREFQAAAETQRLRHGSVRAQGSGWEPPEQVIKAVLSVCLHAGEHTPNYPAGVGREGGAAPIAIA